MPFAFEKASLRPFRGQGVGNRDADKAGKNRQRHRDEAEPRRARQIRDGQRKKSDARSQPGE